MQRGAARRPRALRLLTRRMKLVVVAVRLDRPHIEEGVCGVHRPEPVDVQSPHVQARIVVHHPVRHHQPSAAGRRNLIPMVPF